MVDAELDLTTALVLGKGGGEEGVFRSSGKVVVNPGWMRAYQVSFEFSFQAAVLMRITLCRIIPSNFPALDTIAYARARQNLTIQRCKSFPILTRVLPFLCAFRTLNRRGGGKAATTPRGCPSCRAGRMSRVAK